MTSGVWEDHTHLAHNQVLCSGCENEVDFVRTLIDSVFSPISPFPLFCDLPIAFTFSLPVNIKERKWLSSVPWLFASLLCSLFSSLSRAGVNTMGEQDSSSNLTFPLTSLSVTHSSVLAWRIPGTGGAWWAAVCGVAQSWTRLKRLSSSSSLSISVNPYFRFSLTSHYTCWLPWWLRW